MTVEQSATGEVVEIEESGRAWQAFPVVTGWRLAFRDPKDQEWTNAGVFATFEDAVREARGDKPMRRWHR